MRIRPADITDLPAIDRLIRESYSKYIVRIGKPPFPMLDNYGNHVRAHTLWVTEDLAGLVVLIPEAEHLELETIAVSPAVQGKGIGRALMLFAEAEARRRGYAELRLYTHEKMTENIALYARAGWTHTHRAHQDGYDRVFFRKSVPAQ